MGLSVVRGGGKQVDQLEVDDLPLGPWAGAELVVWATKTGTRWHANESCTNLSSQARTDTYTQPETGTLGDRNLPAGLHCDPTGPLGNHVRAAKHLVEYAHATDSAQAQLDADDIPLDVLPYVNRWALNRLEIDELATGSLAETWIAERERRDRVVDQARHQLDPAGERTAMMTIADWVRNGRTPRQHQLRYARFVDLGAEELSRQDLTISMGRERYVNDRLPDWLDSVVAGRATGNASRTLVEHEHERERSWPGTGDVADRVRVAWAASTVRWNQAIEAMAQAHPGAVLAMFHYYGTGIDRNLIDACIDVGPAAQLKVGDLDWVVAVVPAAFRLTLIERNRGLNGLILLEEDLHRVNAEVCVRFLRNLVTHFGHPELAEHATSTRCRGHDADVTDIPPEVAVEVRLPWQQHGFASEGVGSGITPAQCAPALRAALDGYDLPVPGVPTTPKKAPPRRRSQS